MAADLSDKPQQSLDVRSIRRALRLTQSEFGSRFGFSLAAVRRWEQGRAQPDAACRAYLATIRHAPDLVAEAIAAAKPELERA